MNITWWAHKDLNLGPTGYEPVALTTELWALFKFTNISIILEKGKCEMIEVKCTINQNLHFLKHTDCAIPNINTAPVQSFGYVQSEITKESIERQSDFAPETILIKRMVR